MFIKAKLIKRVTDDGLMEMKDDIELGKVYNVDLSCVHRTAGYNIDHKRFWEREMVMVDSGEWFPLELLDIAGGGGNGREIKVQG